MFLVTSKFALDGKESLVISLYSGASNFMGLYTEDLEDAEEAVWARRCCV